LSAVSAGFQVRALGRNKTNHNKERKLSLRAGWLRRVKFIKRVLYVIKMHEPPTREHENFDR
jgi:hypothetical protein